ncbi:MAG: hypothetical protein AB8F26_01110 [Phycisphaerales bacterium]
MNEPSDTKAAIARPLRELGFIVVSIVVGLLLAFALLRQVFIPTVGFPGDLERLVLLDKRVRQAPDGARRIAIVSNSVGVEGVEGSTVGSMMDDGFVVENQAANGLDLLSARIYIGHLLGSQPDTVVWILRPELMGQLKELNPEVASAMRLAGFAESADWINATPPPPGLDEEMIARLKAGDLSNTISLRTLPLRHLNQIVRTRARKGILAARPMNIDAPYQIDTQLEGEKLARHISDVTESYHQRTADNNRDGLAFIEQTVGQIRAASVRAVLVIAPTHPDATDFVDADAAFAEALREISQRSGAPLINLSGLLAADEFADAIHPNRVGSARFSAGLGNALAPILNPPGEGG